MAAGAARTNTPATIPSKNRFSYEDAPSLDAKVLGVCCGIEASGLFLGLLGMPSSGADPSETHTAPQIRPQPTFLRR